MNPRETKEDRIVRNMTAQLTEQLIELKNLASGPSKEVHLEPWCFAMIKSVLGFSAGAGYQVRNQETRGKMRFDLVVARSEAPEQILLVAEIKKLGSDLNKSDLRSGKSQLGEYLKTIGDVRWGILTNGFEWRLYDFKNDLTGVANVDLRNEAKEIDLAPKLITEAAWDFLDFSAHYYESKTWEKLSLEARTLSPDSLARSILSTETIKKIAKALNEEHGYRVSIDQLTDKLAELLEEGLNDLVGSWNESKRAELDRYIRGQKKQAKKAKKRSEHPESSADAPEESAIVTKKVESVEAATVVSELVTEENKVA